MADKLQIYLFGSPQFIWQDKPLSGFVSNKARSLLIYLAVTGRSHSRDTLSELLWADTPASKRANLKRALSNLRNLDGIALREEGQQLVALDPQHVWVDVVEFAQMATDTTTGDITALQRAVQLHQAEFLVGFPLSLSYEFEAWVLAEQARLKEQLVTLLRRLADEYAQRDDLPQAIATVRRLVQLEPWQEGAHRQLIGLLAQHGEVGAALAHFAACRTQLREELDVEPAAATLELVAQIRAGAFRSQRQHSSASQLVASRPAALNESLLATDGDAKGKELTADLLPTRIDPPSHNLPLPSTPFVGRSMELTKLAELIAKPECRLITLVGPGGSGKTRLAIEAAKRAHPTFADGATFVALAPLAAAELVVPTVATALNITLSGQTPPQTQLVQYLRGQARLLILDNLEQLLPVHNEPTNAAGENEALALIRAILAQAPDVIVLVTSRERLHLQGECVYAVEGLDVPSGNGDIPALAHSAPTLFIQTAQRAVASFAPTANDEAAILQICRLVDGMPLAIELAAAWVRVLPCREIVAEIEAGLGILTTSLHDLPTRHRSMRAIFDHSWQLLSAEEQRGFARCSVFRGGFTREAAVNVAGATLTVLAGLIDKSLLSRTPQGRYEIHELARQYGADRLAEMQELAGTRNRHLRYFMTLSETAEPKLRSGPDIVGWHDRVEREHDNLRAALDWAFTEGDFVAGLHMIGALWQFWKNRGYSAEGYSQAERFSARSDVAAPMDARAKSLHTAGELAYDQCQYLVASARLSDGIALCQALGSSGTSILAMLLVTQANLTINVYGMDAVEAMAQELLALGHALQDSWVLGHALLHLGLVARDRGDVSQALDYFHRGVEEFFADGQSVMRGIALKYVGTTYFELNNYLAAEKHLGQSLRILQELGDKNRSSIILKLLGNLAFAQGNTGKAQVRLTNALHLAREAANTGNALEAMDAIGRLAQRQEDYVRAYNLHREVLMLGIESENPNWIAFTLEAFACLAVRQGQVERAAQLFGAAEVHCISADAYQAILRPTRDPLMSSEHERLVTLVREELGEIVFGEAWHAGASMDLAQAVDCALESQPLLTQ
ncbi:MAG: BTAD domain-containing putative transcriptional regulator [Caldilineaceae bacterium]